MSNTKIILIAILILLAGGLGYYTISPLFKDIEINDELPENIITGEQNGQMSKGSEETEGGSESLFSSPSPTPQETGQGESASEETTEETAPQQAGAEPKHFPVMGTAGHPASGTVRILETAEETIIRYENFSTINGPNLHVYLSKDMEANDYVDLGTIRGTAGNINYTVPENVDISEYKYVMYWCVPFSVLFNYAKIN